MSIGDPPLSPLYYAPDAPGKPLGCVAGTGRHDTYLHAGAGKGWPHDHKAEDTFEVHPLKHEWSEDRIYNITPPLNVLEHPELIGMPMITIDTRDNGLINNAPEYKAEFGHDGSANLVLYTPRRLIAKFDTMADAQLAAEALNNHKGY